MRKITYCGETQKDECVVNQDKRDLYFHMGFKNWIELQIMRGNAQLNWYSSEKA